MENQDPDICDENRQSEEDDMESLQVLGIGLDVVDDTDGRFRFNSENSYVPRQTTVLTRCVIVDIVHGPLSTTDLAPCTLLVFDFQLDRIKNCRIIHSALITLILSAVKVRGLAPDHSLNQDPQELSTEINQGVSGNIGVDQFAQIGLSGHRDKSKKTSTIKYASAIGWTQHYPRPLVNEPSPHNCVKWSVTENPAQKDKGVPPHFRAAVLLEREDEDSEFQIDMEIEIHADLRTNLEDYRYKLFGGTAAKGHKVIHPQDPSTNRLKMYQTFLGDEDLNKISCLSLGRIAEKLFD
ncbi:hypothetical protein DSL72_003247 [Monilinia vaccinii-corymbosi]|uniref:Uncharacterized protein n=1 Tax=Monilinia vaccinii-corymbosi TaxID=61207 RepID=A0A8A3NSR4_9HELO|nr:hypothetical protein DSL72_003247 [Monilinia vaccinii-corymbosi]